MKRSVKVNLYYVGAPSPDGEKDGYGLFVRASSSIGAIRAWQRYYAAGAALPEYVDEIPETPARGAIRWENVPRVWQNGEEALDHVC